MNRMEILISGKGWNPWEIFGWGKAYLWGCINNIRVSSGVRKHERRHNNLSRLVKVFDCLKHDCYSGSRLLAEVKSCRKVTNNYFSRPQHFQDVILSRSKYSFPNISRPVCPSLVTSWSLSCIVHLGLAWVCTYVNVVTDSLVVLRTKHSIKQKKLYLSFNLISTTCIKHNVAAMCFKYFAFSTAHYK